MFPGGAVCWRLIFQVAGFLYFSQTTQDQACRVPSRARLCPTTLTGCFLSTGVVCVGYYFTYALLLHHQGPRDTLLTACLPVSGIPMWNGCFAYQWTTHYGPQGSTGSDCTPVEAIPSPMLPLTSLPLEVLSH